MSSETRPLGPSIAFVRTGPAFRAREEAACHFPFGGVEIPWRRDGGVDLSLPRLGGEATRWRLRLGFRDRGELVSRSAGIYQENRKIGGGGATRSRERGPRAPFTGSGSPLRPFLSHDFCVGTKKGPMILRSSARGRESPKSQARKRDFEEEVPKNFQVETRRSPARD